MHAPGGQAEGPEAGFQLRLPEHSVSGEQQVVEEVERDDAVADPLLVPVVERQGDRRRPSQPSGGTCSSKTLFGNPAFWPFTKV